MNAPRLAPAPALVTPMLHALDLLGCAVFAVGGAPAAGRKGLDLLGGGVATGAGMVVASVRLPSAVWGFQLPTFHLDAERQRHLQWRDRKATGEWEAVPRRGGDRA